MGDQALDRADAQAVLLAELHQLRQARHCAVVVQDLAEHAGRLQPGHARKIDRRFGVPGAPQHAAILRAQGKDVTWLHKVVRRSILDSAIV